MADGASAAADSGEVHTLKFVVGAADTSVALGSGELSVLGTPRLVAWMEAATVVAVAVRVPEGATSVGTHVAIDHVRAAGLGASVVVGARVINAADRFVECEVWARESGTEASPSDGAAVGAELASGRIVRAIVDVERFLRRVR